MGNCLVCGEVFPEGNIRQKYCSNACRVRSQRQNNSNISTGTGTGTGTGTNDLFSLVKNNITSTISPAQAQAQAHKSRKNISWKECYEDLKQRYESFEIGFVSAYTQYKAVLVSLGFSEEQIITMVTEFQTNIHRAQAQENNIKKPENDFSSENKIISSQKNVEKMSEKDISSQEMSENDSENISEAPESLDEWTHMRARELRGERPSPRLTQDEEPEPEPEESLPKPTLIDGLKNWLKPKPKEEPSPVVEQEPSGWIIPDAGESRASLHFSSQEESSSQEEAKPKVDVWESAKKAFASFNKPKQTQEEETVVEFPRYIQGSSHSIQSDAPTRYTIHNLGLDPKPFYCPTCKRKMSLGDSMSHQHETINQNET